MQAGNQKEGRVLFIEVTPTYGDHKLYVQPGCIAMIKPTKWGCELHLAGGQTIPIKDSIESILGQKIEEKGDKKSWLKGKIVK